MFKKIHSDNFYLYGTEVENFFISDFMTKAPGEYVKAYLLALMFAQLGSPADNENIKRRLEMTDEQIEDCWAYWEKCGVIRRKEYDIEFVNLREMIGSSAAAVSEHVESRLDDRDLAQLFKNIQRACGRMLSSSEMNEIASWINDLHINSEVILYCYKYCSLKGKSNSYRYIAAILKDWNEKGLKTADDVAGYLSDSDARFSAYKSIFSELGFSRNPTAEEKRMMNAWLDEYGYSLSEILDACKHTISISNPNLKYVDAVLRNTKGAEPDADLVRENSAVRISQLYENIRKENEEKTRRNRAEVFSRIPRIKDIMEKLGEASLKQTRALLNRDGQALAEARKEIERLVNEKNGLLDDAGFSRTAVDTVYSCAKCKDTGVLEDGTACSCYAEKLEEINGKGKA